MSTAPPKSQQVMRWLFLVTELVVIVTLLGAELADYCFNLVWDPWDSVLSAAHFVLFVVSWCFLLFVGPFFLRSLRGLAFAGWIIAFGLIVVGMLLPVR